VKEPKESAGSETFYRKTGIFTRYIQKYIGFKGPTYIIATIAMFTGEMSCMIWAGVALTLSGMKAGEDLLRRRGK